MHYYQFNIKDYSFATMRMTLLEDLAFRRMLDLFYESEKPLPLDFKKVAKSIGMTENQEEVKSVLSDFWNKSDDGWVNSRALDEIEKYQAKADAARANGKKGGRPPKPNKTQSVNLANPEKSESKANHKPITNNHKPNKDICQQIADAWNECFPELPQVVKVSQKRKSHLMACVKEFTGYNLDKPESWRDLFNYASQSDFLMGRSSHWSMDFDFIINKTNLLKVIEGNYDNGQ